MVESDTLTQDEVGAVFAYLNRRLQYTLHCIIDTAGKSLHGWFDAPRNKVLENRLKAGLEVFGCDPKVFTYSQPVRVPGAFRDGETATVDLAEAMKCSEQGRSDEIAEHGYGERRGNWKTGSTVQGWRADVDRGGGWTCRWTVLHPIVVLTCGRMLAPGG